MSEPNTLDTMDQLRICEFGRPKPRHGLKLLYWFAKDGISFNNNNVMMLQCRPEGGAYGFHEFHNKYEKNGAQYCRLLPLGDLTYYEVGNLSQAADLPDYVRKDFKHQSGNGNKDRIIISYNAGSVGKVYITEHYNNTCHFNREKTYQINQRLLKQIKNLTLDQFLITVGYQTRSDTSSIQIQPVSTNRPADIGIDMGSLDPFIVNHHEVDNRCNCVIL